jgi:hypothetical protein
LATLGRVPSAIQGDLGDVQAGIEFVSRTVDIQAGIVRFKQVVSQQIHRRGQGVRGLQRLKQDVTGTVLPTEVLSAEAPPLPDTFAFERWCISARKSTA